ncbi:MAG: NAD-dependent epimerase/dehydratase family protein [Brotaphodocola sp.]
MRAVVTGATSFIGSVVVRQLLMEGHMVCAVVRPGTKNMDHLMRQIPVECQKQLILQKLDMCDIKCLSKLLGETVWDAFVHVGWDGAGSDNRTKRDVQQLNVVHSLEAVRTAAELGCSRFLFTGSQAEYGVYHQPITEDMACHPVSEYGKAKTEFANQAKNLCKILKMEYIHTRIFSVYGPGDHPWSLVNTCLKTWQQGGEMKLGECTQKWNFLYIEDAAAALIALLKYGKGGVYNVAGEDTRGLREYIEEMYALCGSQGSFVYGERPQNAEGPADLMPVITKICEETGWKPGTSFAEGIYETLHSLREGIA